MHILRPDASQPDLVEVARLAKRRFPDCPTVVGGPAVPRRPDAIEQFFRRNEAVDVLILGEGEVTFRELLESIERGSDLVDVPGLALRAEDAARGLKAGLITRVQHDAICRAIDRKQIPPWNTPLGGEIFLHGHGSASDWTIGCIALDDADITELYEVVPTKTTVIIEP